MEQLEVKLTEITADLKTFKEKAQEEIKANGEVATETKSALETIRTEMRKMQDQLDAVDAKSQKSVVMAPAMKTMGQMVIESPEFVARKKEAFTGARPIRFAHQGSPFALKTINPITDATIGGATSGILVQQRIPGVIVMAQQELRVRDLMRVRPLTTGNSFDWVRQKTRTNNVSPQVEAASKVESTYAWETASGVVQTLAHFAKMSTQALDDVDFLRQQIDSELMYGLKLKEEAELLFGDGTGVHLKGVGTSATAYDTSLNATGDTYIDQLRNAKLQARLLGKASFAPDAFVLSPTDIAKIEKIKSNEGQTANNGRYILGDPGSGAKVLTIWGLPVVESDSIATGKFLVGAFGSAAYIVDRMVATVDISFEDGTNFESNLATIRCEERVGLANQREDAFVIGTFA